MDGRGDGEGGEEVQELLDWEQLRSWGVMSKGLEKFQPTGIQNPLASQRRVLHIVCMAFSGPTSGIQNEKSSPEDLNQGFEKLQNLQLHLCSIMIEPF